MTNKNTLQTLIKHFASGDLKANALALFKELGYQSPRTLNKPINEILSAFNPEKALFSEWLNAPFLFQLAQDNLSNIQSLLTDVDGTIIESYLFVAIELEKPDYSRTQLVTITRELNKSSQPVLILFKHGNTLTLSVIHRRLHKRDDSRDVLEKVTLLKDIRINEPHRAHLDILAELAFAKLNLKANASFVDLHNAWQTVLDTKTLNKQFYKELSQWYFWAMKEVYFPDAENIEAVKGGVFEDENKVREHNAKSLIRLLTRLLFVWFIKEKNLIPEQLFNEDWIKSQLKEFKPHINNSSTATFQANDSHFYRAILQNLFFATLNQTCEKRQFRNDGQHRNVTNLMRYKSYFSEPDAFLKLVSEVVPFMNGGLFDCLDKVVPDLKGKQGGDVIAYEDGFSDRPDNKLRVPDYIFFGTHKNVDLSQELGNKQKSVEIKGLIDILKSYKFTITENTPIEEDIALDPELLGQVFENLLASYNPETKTTARKQTGSFYTPREIVDYMVDESLKAYFKSNTPHLTTEQLDDLLSYTKPTPEFSEEDKTALIEAIDTCKILDPACGSGAFPMGVLHKLVFILGKIDPDNELWKQRQIKEKDSALQKRIIEAFTDNEVDYARKLYLIENCIYGVDIQAIAIQISKLRFFISLIVDQKIDNQKPNFGVLPLPNLETKFVAANTLIDIEKPKKQTSLFDSKEIEALEEKLKKVRHSLFSVRSPSRKRELREEDKLLREQIGELLEQHGWGNETAQQLAHWNPYDQNANADFFNLEWMFGETGFDIVIGNPPYVQLQKMTNSSVLAKQNYSTYAKSGDLYCLFYEKGIDFLKHGGNLCYITSNSWMRTKYGEAMRKLFAEESNPIQLVNFENAQIFESAIVESNILIVEKNTFKNQMKACNLANDLNDSISLASYIAQKNVIIRELDNNGWVVGNNNVLNLKKKIENNAVQLQQLDLKIISGVKTGFNEAFIIDAETKERLCLADPKSTEIIKPLLRGRDIKKYAANFANYWLINSHNGLKIKSIKPVNVKNDYPVIFEFLKQFQEKLEIRPSKGEHWTNVPATFSELYDKPKIIWGELSDQAKFTYDDSGIYVEATVFLMTGKNLKFILAILNSTLAQWYFEQISTTSGMGTNRWKKYKIEQFPIKQIHESEQQPFIKLVDYILFIKKQPFYTSMDLNFAEERLMSNFFENLIDALVYELYFPEELHEAKKQFMSLVVQENLPDLDSIEGAKVGALKQIVRRLTDKNHPLYNNLFFLDSVPVVRIIEGKA